MNLGKAFKRWANVGCWNLSYFPRYMNAASGSSQTRSKIKLLCFIPEFCLSGYAVSHVVPLSLRLLYHRPMTVNKSGEWIAWQTELRTLITLNHESIETVLSDPALCSVCWCAAEQILAVFQPGKVLLIRHDRYEGFRFSP